MINRGDFLETTLYQQHGLWCNSCGPGRSPGACTSSFFDFDAYSAELTQIHEQLKQERGDNQARVSHKGFSVDRELDQEIEGGSGGREERGGRTGGHLGAGAGVLSKDAGAIRDQRECLQP